MKGHLFLLLSCVLGLPAWAEDKPEEMLAAAKKLSAQSPWKVTALAAGDRNFKIAGIIAGEDFDLTIRDPKGETRQIVVGAKGWSSTDAGKTWKPVKTIDRRYYYITHAPINYQDGEKIPPFEKVETLQQDGETLVHVRFIAEQKVSYEGDRSNSWLVMKDGAPVGVRRFMGPLVFERDYPIVDVHYAALKDDKGVLPPPGNPEAVPEVNPAEAWLAQAQKHTDSIVSEVQGTIAGPKTISIHGLLKGRDYDLTFKGEDGAGTRQVVVGEKAWLSYDGGKTWKTGTPDDRLIYNLAHTPLLGNRMTAEFEDAGKEDHDGVPWQHLRLKVAEKLESESQRPHYWIEMDAKGQPLGIRRYEGAAVINGGTLNCKLDYAPSKEKAISKPVLGKK